MNNLLFTSLLSFAVNSVNEHFSNSILITTVVMTLSAVTAVYWLKKREEQRKKLRKLKWKLRWTLLKTFFKQKRKKNIGLVIFYFLLMTVISVLLVLWVGWLPGIVTFLLSLLVIYAMP